MLAPETIATSAPSLRSPWEATYCFSPARASAPDGSGTLRDAIAGGERAEVFASANMAHPQSLAKAGRASSVVLFARNRLCALARPGLASTQIRAQAADFVKRTTGLAHVRRWLQEIRAAIRRTAGAKTGWQELGERRVGGSSASA